MKRNFSSLSLRLVTKSILLPAAALTLVTLSDAVGANLTWDGQNNNGIKGNTWNTSNNNWTGGGSSFANGDNVTFGSNSAYRSVNINAGVTLAPGTISIQDTYSFSGGGSIQATGAITISGALTLNATSTNTASLPLLSTSSTLTVNNSGSLILAGTGNNLGDTTSISLSGGQIQISGSGSSETLGALTLSSSPSSLNYSGTGSSLTFASLTGSPGTILNVFNFDPADHLYLTSALPAGVQINFYSGSTATPGQEVSYSAEVVPEPSTIIAGIGLVGFLGWRERRRIGSLLKRNRDEGELATA
ncbi:PEP-CTERM sorting domain-containing protein [Verrucomicrobiota bacterium sgz303538]